MKSAPARNGKCRTGNPDGRRARARRPRAAGPTRPRAEAVSRVIAPVPSNRAWTDNEFQSKLTAPATSWYAASRRARQTLIRSSSRSNRTPPGRIRPAPEAAAAQESGQVEEIAPDAPAVRGGRQETRRRRPGPRGRRCDWPAAPARARSRESPEPGSTADEPASASTAWQ